MLNDSESHHPMHRSLASEKSGLAVNRNGMNTRLLTSSPASFTEATREIREFSSQSKKLL